MTANDKMTKVVYRYTVGTILKKYDLLCSISVTKTFTHL